MVDFDFLSNIPVLDQCTNCTVSPLKYGVILIPLIALCTFITLPFLKPPQSDQIPTLPPPPALPPTLPPLPPPQQPPTVISPPPPPEPIIRQPSEIITNFKTFLAPTRS